MSEGKFYMAAQIQDLWPQDLAVRKQRAPVAILRHQATLLGQKTNFLLEGRVHTEGNEGEFAHKFYIVAPALNDYSHLLFSIRHGITLYPLTLTVTGEMDRPILDEGELLDALRARFESGTTRDIISSLLAQIEAVPPEKVLESIVFKK